MKSIIFIKYQFHSSRWKNWHEYSTEVSTDACVLFSCCDVKKKRMPLILYKNKNFKDFAISDSAAGQLRLRRSKHEKSPFPNYCTTTSNELAFLSQPSGEWEIDGMKM